ncbi:MAG: glycosyltransferase, partial [Gaiellales bacterium]
MRVLVVHNRYRSAQPSGENAVVEEETALLREAGAVVELLSVESDDIAGWPAAKRLTLPARVVWSRDGARAVRRAIAGFRPDVVHAHNTFPLLSPAALRAAHGTGVRVVQTLHNFRPLCPAATFLRDGRVCEDCLGRVPIPAVVHGCYRSSRAATLPIAVKDA